MTDDLKFYFSLFWRRVHYFLLISIAVAGAGVTLAFTLPPVYTAYARLLVEVPQITASTVQANVNELLDVIRQNILTRNNLLDLSRRFDVHTTKLGMTPDEIVTDMNKRMSFWLPATGRGNTGASFVEISFSAPTATMSAAVTNEVVTQFLQQNIALRTSATAETLDFSRQEVTRLDDELAQQGAKILQFKLDNKDALPESLTFRRARQSTLQEQLLGIERNLAGLRDRRERMIALFERTGNVSLAGQTLSPEEQNLRNLEAQLASALVIYSEQNPTVVNLKAQVAAAQKTIGVDIDSTDSGDGDLSLLDLQLSDLDGQIEVLELQKSAAAAEIEVLAASIEATPTNAITLSSLQRDFDNIQVLYNAAAAQLAAARTGDRVESQSRGERIVVVEQAVPPNEPSSPNRKKIAATSIGLGIALGVGFIALLEMLNNAIRRPSEISSRLGIKPFATIPLIQTKRQLGFRRLKIGSVLLLVTVGIPLALYILHIYYLPMDLLIERILNKLGLSEILSLFR
ncbi:MAG: Wzz/FepE/Etk N-terminal domain-containing protein [Paracoccaceae bacterium]